MAVLARTNMKKSLIPKRNRKEIHQYLFREGVMVVKKDPTLPEHPELKGIPNLHVMMVMRSLKSHNYVSEKFNWQHHYYILTPEGISHLRDILDLPGMVHPATYARKSRPGESLRRLDRDEGGWRGDEERPRGRGRRDFNTGAGGGFGREQGYANQMS